MIEEKKDIEWLEKRDRACQGRRLDMVGLLGPL